MMCSWGLRPFGWKQAGHTQRHTSPVIPRYVSTIVALFYGEINRIQVIINISLVWCRPLPLCGFPCFIHWVFSEENLTVCLYYIDWPWQRLRWLVYYSRQHSGFFILVFRFLHLINNAALEASLIPLLLYMVCRSGHEGFGFFPIECVLLFPFKATPFGATCNL